MGKLKALFWNFLHIFRRNGEVENRVAISSYISRYFCSSRRPMASDDSKFFRTFIGGIQRRNIFTHETMVSVLLFNNKYWVPHSSVYSMKLFLITLIPMKTLSRNFQQWKKIWKTAWFCKNYCKYTWMRLSILHVLLNCLHQEFIPHFVKRKHILIEVFNHTFCL